MTYSRTNKINFWDTVLLFVCFYLTFKQLNVLFPSVSIILSLLLGCIAILFVTKFRIRGKSILYLFLYAIVLALNYMTGDVYFDSWGDVVQEIGILFFTSTLYYYVFIYKHIKFARVLVFITLSIIIYYSITSYLLEQLNPGIIRNSVYMTNLGEFKELRVFYIRGLPTYQLPHALPILIPPLIMVIRDKSNNNWVRLYFIVSLIAVFVIAFVSYAATAAFLAIVMLILTLMVRPGSTQENLIRLIVVAVIVLPFLIVPDLLLRSLMRLFSMFGDAPYLDKLMDIQTLTSSGSSTGSVAAREVRYETTFHQIIENPLFGTNRRTGEHSAIFDRWACLGLVGWVPYLAYLICQFRMIYKGIDKNSRIYFTLGLMASLFMLLTKNMSDWETWYFTFSILPIMVWLPVQKRGSR